MAEEWLVQLWIVTGIVRGKCLVGIRQHQPAPDGANWCRAVPVDFLLELINRLVCSMDGESQPAFKSRHPDVTSSGVSFLITAKIPPKNKLPY